MNVSGFIFPLATLDDVIDELEDTNRALLRLAETDITFAPERHAERKANLLKWRRLLVFQRDRMVEQGAVVSGRDAA